MGKQRRQEILRRVQRNGYVSARELAGEYGVDASTIRRDLDTMARLEMIVRSHGGARASVEPAEIPYDVKVERNVPQKRAIAQAVAARVGEGKSLLLDSGSTTLEVARALRSHRGMTVITNDLRVAAEIANQGDVRLIVIGGEVLPSVYTLTSEHAVDLIGEYQVDYAVLGADAVDPRGITNTNSFEAPMKRAMIRAADQVILVTDSSKFGHTALVRVSGFEDVDLIITDDGLDEDDAADYPTEVVRVEVTLADTSGRDRVAEPARASSASSRTAMEPALVPSGTRQSVLTDREQS